MIRMATAMACVLCLSACASLPEWAMTHQFLGRSEPTGSTLTHYNFDWQLSGDRQVAPVQVFDDGSTTWLHFLPDQILPAIFQHSDQGDRLLSPVRQGEYHRLDGLWPELRFRGGALTATARKHDSDIGTAHPSASLLSAQDPFDSDAAVQDLPILPAVSDERVEPEADFTAVMSDTPSGVHDDTTGLFTEASFESLIPSSFSVRLQDGNLRHVLHRWAARAGWTFAPEHWAVDVDIPISGEADFHGGFEDAVQDALAATELADRPLRPCFYSNRVLRVVAFAQSCDRSGGGLS